MSQSEKFRTYQPSLPDSPVPDPCYKFDMHVHSGYSSDSINSVDAIVKSWENNGILPLVCDHDTIRGSLKVYSAIRKKDPDIPLILAEEIMTIDGEIIGAFLTEEISPGQSAEETLDEIRSQGGISILPHPFCTYRRSAITSEARERISGDIDCIEGYNARILRETENIKAVMHARKYSKPVSVGSDAHTPFELGISYVTLAPFSTQYDLLKNLRAGAIVFRMTNPKIHYITKVVKAVKLLQPGFSL